MNGMDNTTHQLHYPVDDATTQAQRVAAHPGATGSPVAAESPTTMVTPPTGVAAPPSYQSDRPPYQSESPAYHRGSQTYQSESPPYPVEREVAVPPPGAHASPEPGRGRTTIAEEVVERVIQKIVDLTADAVDGVHGLRAGVDQFFGAETSTTDRAVAVTLNEEQATINIAIEVEFGYAVHDVVDQVRGSVIGSTERLLGLTVAEVNVVVADVSFADASPAEAASGEAPSAATPSAAASAAAAPSAAATSPASPASPGKPSDPATSSQADAEPEPRTGSRSRSRS